MSENLTHLARRILLSAIAQKSATLRLSWLSDIGRQQRQSALGAESSAAVPISPSSLLAVEGSDLLVNVDVNRNVAVVPPIVRRPYYGAIVAGVALGTIIVATAIAPTPSPELCWYWTSSPHTQGCRDYYVPH